MEWPIEILRIRGTHRASNSAYGASRHMLCILSLQRDLVLEEISQGELEWGVMGLFILTSITSECPLKYIFIKNHNKSIYD